MNYEKMYSTIDAHVAGEAFRIVTQSPIRLRGGDIHAQHEELKNNFTTEKSLLLNEPRGHRGMHGCIVGPSKNADISLLFFNHRDVSDFKYEGLLAAVTALLETGNLSESADGVYEVETVTGIHTVKARMENSEVTSAAIENRSCSEIKADPDYTLVRIDDDRSYALYPLPESISAIELEHLVDLNRWGLERTTELNAAHIPYEGVVVIESDPSSPGEVKTVTFEKDGYILRSPGVDSTIALLAALSQKEGGQSRIENRSIFGSSLCAKKAEGEPQRFSVETEAFVTGSHEFIFDQDDPLKEGFLLV